MGLLSLGHLKQYSNYFVQCYDQYLLKSLRKAAEVRGHSFWAKGPDNAGSYNSQPHETGLFCDGGDYNGYYGRFFLNWYSQVLVDHVDRVLLLAKLAFEGCCIAAKVSKALRNCLFKMELYFLSGCDHPKSQLQDFG